MRKDGSRFWGSITLTAIHDPTGQVIGFTKVTRDLSERKAAEDELKAYADELEKKNRALQKSEEKYHKMISEVEDYAIILLNENGEIQNWNIGAQKIKGYSSDEIVGKNFQIFYPLSDREQKLPQKLLNDAKVNGKAVHEGWRIRKDGSKFWGSIVLTALHGADKTIIGFSKVTRDLTERKHAEDTMKKYLTELEVQNKELEQFAYIASHDLQEPLRKIQTFSNLIVRNYSDQQAAMRYIDRIKISAKRMSDLIEAVLNFSRLARDDSEAVNTDLNSVLDNVLNEIGRAHV